MEMDGDGRRPKHPVAGAMMVDGTNQADRDNRNAQLLRHAETTVLELINVAIATALRFRKNDQAGAAVDGVLREPPHALEIGRTAHIRDRNISEALHEPAIGGDFEVGFQFPATDVLRDGAIQHERIKEIDVIHHEEAGAVRIETGRANYLQARSREKNNAAAEAALKPVVPVGVQEDSEEDESWCDQEEVQAAQNPEKRAAKDKQAALHI